VRSVSQVRWINRSTVEAHLLDIEHGLAFAPTCHRVSGHLETDVESGLLDADIVVLTLGVGVPSGGTRIDAFVKNREIYREKVLPAVRSFPGVVLVVTNPVDLMAREIGMAIGGATRRVLGLGTVVETARLRASLASHLEPWRRPSDIDAFAVGTHDERFVPVAVHQRLCPTMDRAEFDAIVEMARVEVAKAARTVKKLGAAGTLHPIVEGIVTVVDTVATDRRQLMTVSTCDPETNLWYSAPCIVGREGVRQRCDELMVGVDLEGALSELQMVLNGPGTAVEPGDSRA